MTTEDIIGKAFICFEFKPPDDKVKFNNLYKSYIGKTATVIKINDIFPQYAEVRVQLDNNKKTYIHYPTQMIIDQIEFNGMSIEDINNYIKQLILKIWKQKTQKR